MRSKSDPRWLCLLLLACFFAWTGCVHKAPFEVKAETQVHKATGVELPKDFPGWIFLPDSVNENVSPEILLSESYQLLDEKNEWKPTATLYILRESTTSNLKVVENRVVTGLGSAQFLKTESVKLKNKKRVILSTYNHSTPWSMTSGGGAKTVKTIKNLSLFATSEKDSKIVVWVIVDRASQTQKEAAFDIFQRALFTADAKNATGKSAQSGPWQKKSKKK